MQELLLVTYKDFELADPFRRMDEERPSVLSVQTGIEKNNRTTKQ